jgi:sRNA-binding carbon storage regulator CsrA
VNVSSLQLRAPEAVDILRNSYRIEPELWDENNILFLLGIGNTPQEVRILRQALESLVTGYKTKTKTGQKGKNKICRELFDFVLPPLH